MVKKIRFFEGGNPSFNVFARIFNLMGGEVVDEGYLDGKLFHGGFKSGLVTREIRRYSIMEQQQLLLHYLYLINQSINLSLNQSIS